MMTREEITRRRMHGLYLSRRCEDIVTLSRELMGLHSWFYRNVAFSALIRGADIYGWKSALTKTWLYRGTLHGAAFDDLPGLLALHPGDESFWQNRDLKEIADEVIGLMEDGVNSRAEMRKLFAGRYDYRTLETAFSPWGGIFVNLARLGRVAFRDMVSRDFDLISAEPKDTPDEALPLLLRRYFKAYGPATLADAAWFLGLWREDKKKLKQVNMEEYSRFELDGSVYYYIDESAEKSAAMNDIPELTLLAGFDPLIVSYTERSPVLPPEYKSAVILKSGICNPTVCVNGRVEGLWNIKKGEPTLTFFSEQPQRIKNAALDMIDEIRLRSAGRF
jgi:hypothetical protein